MKRYEQCTYILTHCTLAREPLWYIRSLSICTTDKHKQQENENLNRIHSFSYFLWLSALLWMRCVTVCIRSFAPRRLTWMCVHTRAHTHIHATLIDITCMAVYASQPRQPERIDIFCMRQNVTRVALASHVHTYACTRLQVLMECYSSSTPELCTIGYAHTHMPSVMLLLLLFCYRNRMCMLASVWVLGLHVCTATVFTMWMCSYLCMW